MFLNTLLKTFIVFIFVGFAPLLVKGMRNALVNMQTGQGGEANENLKMFSLSELSFLMKILNKININEDYKPIEVLLNDKGVEVIREDNLQVDHEFIGDFQRKIRAVRKGRWK
uniref:Uncharacterized protein n=1 Tax=Meloidogyne enterolobii TaxID=390850 RepID=A0A6V7TSX0_MELEN|nr:unnamed protein product [Meloidogyne enterolobii]